MSVLRTRWAALGAAVAVSLGAGGIGLVSATSPSGASTLVSITPCRVMDTRPDFNVGPKASPIGADETYTVGAHGDNGDCTGIPADALALSMNVTAVEASANTFLTLWAADAPQPTASSLNPTPGAPPTPNAVTTQLNADGEFSIYNLAGNVHVLADINGYYVDHHHDDRYYTQAEIDALPATGSVYAHVTRDAGGDFVMDASRSKGVIDVVLPSTGNRDRPCVILPTSIDRDTAVAIATVDAQNTPDDETASVHHRVGGEGSQGCPPGSLALYIRRNGTGSTQTVAFNVLVP